MDGTTLWGFVREYVQAEVEYSRCYALGGPGATITQSAALNVSRAETAARTAFEKLQLDEK